MARPHRSAGDAAERTLLPILELLVQGPSAGHDVGERIFSGASLAMWEEALRSAPPHAIALALQNLMVTDGRDPASNIVWCPAAHLAVSPRPFTRLFGLTSRSWPRSENDDPLIPDHILSRRTLRPMTTAECDRLRSHSWRNANDAHPLTPGTQRHGWHSFPKRALARRSNRAQARPHTGARFQRAGSSSCAVR